MKMMRTFVKYLSVFTVLITISSCAAVSFVTDCCKAHFINESSYDVTITSNEPGEKTKTIVLAPGKKKMVSYSKALGTWNYGPQGSVTYTEHTEAWWDVNFGISRTDVYYRFADI
jgi:hypothetical protein